MYWPNDRSQRYQCFVVDPIAEYNLPQYTLREFKVILNLTFLSGSKYVINNKFICFKDN